MLMPADLPGPTATWPRRFTGNSRSMPSSRGSSTTHIAVGGSLAHSPPLTGRTVPAHPVVQPRGSAGQRGRPRRSWQGRMAGGPWPRSPGQSVPAFALLTGGPLSGEPVWGMAHWSYIVTHGSLPTPVRGPSGSAREKNWGGPLTKQCAFVTLEERAPIELAAASGEQRLSDSRM